MENVTDIEVAEDVRQSPEYGEYTKKIGWKTVRIQRSASSVQIFLRKLGLVSIAKIQRVNLPLPWEEISQILKNNRVFMCKLEPTGSTQYSVLSAQGFRLDKWPLIGAKTLRLSLSLSLRNIYAGFRKDARYCLRQALSAKHKVLKNNYDDFYNIWKQANRIKHLWTPKKRDYQSLVKSFGKKCFCITIDNLAGCLVLTHKGVAYYYYSGSLPEGKRKNIPYLVVWEAMKQAKKRGCKIWDFEGIYDERWPNKGWKGFSHFKKSFGGTEVEFPGSFTRWMWPF